MCYPLPGAWFPASPLHRRMRDRTRWFPKSFLISCSLFYASGLNPFVKYKINFCLFLFFLLWGFLIWQLPASCLFTQEQMTFPWAQPHAGFWEHRHFSCHRKSGLAVCSGKLPSILETGLGISCGLKSCEPLSAFPLSWVAVPGERVMAWFGTGNVNWNRGRGVWGVITKKTSRVWSVIRAWVRGYQERKPEAGTWIVGE